MPDHIYNYEWQPRKVNLYPESQPQPKCQPKVWMSAKILRDQATQSEAITSNYCDICTLSGRICPSMWENFTAHLDHVELLEEEERERR